MTDTLEKLARSLTADNTALIPHLPYLLQDFWALGSSPADMLHLFQKNIAPDPNMKVLDLACGKGAVSIQMAQALGIHFKGIDFFPEFIDQARKKALEAGVSDLCRFEVGDANDSLKTERDYDCVIFGAVGNIFGDHKTSLKALIATIKKGGYILFDDAYVADEGQQLNSEHDYPTYEEWRAIFKGLKLEMIDCLDSSNISHEQVEKEMNWIISRADELKRIHPSQKDLFDQYVENQRSEYQDLEHDLVGATWLLRTESA